MIAITARRNGCSRDEAEDFGSWARLRLLEDDCRRIRRFTGASSFATYVTVVLQNLFLDYRTAKWGKWRPSASARRRGALAVRLETLVHRDGLEPEQAFEQLRAEGAVERLDQVEELLAELPRRPRPVTVGTERLEELPEPGRIDGAERLEQQARARALQGALDRALAGLDSEDRVLLRLHFVEGVRLVDLEKPFQTDVSSLYSRLRSLKRQLRAALESEGITAGQVAELLDGTELDLHLDLEPGEDGSSTSKKGSNSARGRQRSDTDRHPEANP